MKKLIPKVVLLLSFVLAFSMQAQQKTVNGMITDQSGMPLAGATVLVKGTGNGSATDFDGNYSLIVNENDLLIVSYVGYITKEVAVKGKNNINVSLDEDAAKLDEVIVVGYGTQKKSNVSGAISTIKVEDVLSDRPSTNILSALQGTLPGFQITSGSGEPGNAGLTANIRGFTSINGGAPIFLLDNVQVSPSDINPHDIETVVVLKDLAASSIYGARAAFGVVLLTSKKGRKNKKPTFNYTLSNSISRPENLPKKATTFDFVHALNDWGLDSYWTGQDIPTWVDFLEQDRANPALYPSGIALDGNGTQYFLRDYDLWDEFFGDMGLTQIHNLNASGGSESVTYRVSGGYTSEDGIIITDNDSFRKYNLSTDLGVQLTDKLSSTTKVFYLRSNRTSPIGSYARSIGYAPFAPASGNHTFDDGLVLPYDTAVNWEKLGTPPRRVQNNFRFFQQFNYKPIKDLAIIGEYTFERETTDNYSTDAKITTVHPYSYAIQFQNTAQSFYYRANTYSKYNALNIYATYDKSLDRHNFKGTIGNNREEYYGESFYSRKENLTSVGLPSLTQATGTADVGDSFGEWGIIGYFGRLNYNFAEKYFLEANIRWDGSSRFPSDDKFASFASFSGAWTISEENFLKDLNNISLFKLRASYGELGNQNTSNYGFIEQFTLNKTSWINPQTGIRAETLDIPDKIISPSFTWEVVQTTNFGLDTAFLNNRLSASFDYYIRNTLGMLTQSKELPGVLGTGAPRTNAADLQTKGWELEASWRQTVGDFSYNLGMSLSDSRTEITKFENEEGLLNQYYVGREIGEIWGYVTDGFYAVNDFVEGSLNSDLTGGTLIDGVPAFKGRNPNPGDIKYKDLNGDGEIFSGNSTLNDPGDMKVIGNDQRRYQYGLFGNLYYKNFDFNFLLNGVGKRDVYQNTNVRFPYPGEFDTVFAHQLDYWTPENTNAYFPRNYPYGGVNYGNSRLTQTKYLLNGAYLRIKNISVGYNVPDDVLNKVKIKKLRLFLAAENLYTWDKLPDGIDTELELKGGGATYPFLKTFSVGINLQF